VTARLKLDFSHAPLNREELIDLLSGWVAASKPFSYDWDFYKKWFGSRPYDAPEHIEMDAMVARTIDVSQTVLRGGIPWNLEFASDKINHWSNGRSVMLRAGPGSGYSFGVSLDRPGSR